MSSIIEGYNYDIFISYRQKDNKGDKWVSEFVEALKTELESTFKEEISVYYDINPHDGLLETHDVDASLKDKLKCLVFIPIISRTYCDPKSFAWEHEFKAFVEQAQTDQFGLKVKLPNGNVASRVLPIRIHDLDIADIKECESVLGGVLRGIEFIYREPGVNKPLTADDDEKINLNRTKYRIQINKVANAIKEILTGIGQYDQKPEVVQKEAFKPISINKKSKKTGIIVGTVTVLALIILGIFLVPKLIKPSKPIEKSIAVLPFINDSPDQENAYFINGIMDEILNNLQKIKDFRVLSRTSTEKYRGSTKFSIPEIAKALEVDYIVEGSGQKYGNTFRLRVQLIAAKNEKHLWAESFEQEIKETKDFFKIQSQIAQSIAAELKVAITPEEKGIIEKIPTTNLTAYDFYLRGQAELGKNPWPVFNYEEVKRAEALFLNALKYDSTFARAYSGLGTVVWTKLERDQTITETNIRTKLIDSLLVLSDIALSYDDKLAEAYIIKSAYYGYKLNLKKQIEELDKAIRYNPNESMAYFLKGLRYDEIDKLKTLENFHKAASLSHGPELINILLLIGLNYYSVGFPEMGDHFFLEVLKLDGDSLAYFARKFNNQGATSGNYQKYIELYKEIYLTDSTKANVLIRLGYYNSLMGNCQESLKYYKEYISILEVHGYSDFWTKQWMEYLIGYAFEQNGYRKESDFYFDRSIKTYIDIINSSRDERNNKFYFYRLAGIYAFRGDKRKAYENLNKMNNSQIAGLGEVIGIKMDPLFNSIRNEPEFKKIVNNMEASYQAEHARIRKWMEEQGKL